MFEKKIDSIKNIPTFTTYNQTSWKIFSISIQIMEQQL